MSEVLSNIVLKQTIDLTIVCSQCGARYRWARFARAHVTPGLALLRALRDRFLSLDRYGTWIRTGKTGVNKRPLRGLTSDASQLWSLAVSRVYCGRVSASPDHVPAGSLTYQPYGAASAASVGR